MRLISADFNAMTEAGHVRLTLPVLAGGYPADGSRPRRLGLAQRR